jgi:uncharacterized protein (TIGR02757 family)
LNAKQRELKALLDAKVKQYNQPDFIDSDPVTIPHEYTQKQDIEISGLFAAVLAWGLRKTIISKCRELFQLMDHAPYQFITQHGESDLKRLMAFKHRTFTTTDLLYFIAFLRHYYSHHDSLEDAFLVNQQAETIEQGLVNFHHQFFSLEFAPHRTRKHIATPERKSACKRLNMFLRWMVRQDQQGVDFGIWKRIRTGQLVCPCDVHVFREARKLKLISRNAADWQSALELTRRLKSFSKEDPVQYDFALFGLGIEARKKGLM